MSGSSLVLPYCHAGRELELPATASHYCDREIRQYGKETTTMLRMLGRVDCIVRRLRESADRSDHNSLLAGAPDIVCEFKYISWQDSCGGLTPRQFKEP